MYPNRKRTIAASSGAPDPTPDWPLVWPATASIDITAANDALLRRGTSLAADSAAGDSRS